MATDPKRADYLFALVFGITFTLGWVGILGYQCLAWLQTAHWPELMIWDGLTKIGIHIDATVLIGLDTIIWWFLNLPLSLVPFLLGMLGLLGAWCTYSEERSQQRWISELRRHR